MKISESKFNFLILYVNNIMFATNDFGSLHETKKYISKSFEIKDIVKATDMIGTKIFCDKS